MKQLNKALNIFDRILDVLAILAGILIVFSTLSVATGVFSRYFLDRPISWVTEISEYILLCTTFLVAAWILRQEGHVRVDILLNLLSRKAQSLVNIVTSVCCAIACFILAWYAIRVTWELYKTNAFTYTVLELPKCIFTAIIFFGSFLLLIEFIRRIYNCFQDWKKPQDSEQSPEDSHTAEEIGTH